jgi:cytochrome oxidase assembly protein ShyY1
VYRFLLTRQWLGFAALMVLLSAAMVGLGFWQLHRYHERSAVNARVAAASRAEPVALDRVLRVGQAPTEAQAWTRVVVAGRYDPAHEIIVRGRTVDGSVGFEVLTPLVREDGSAVLVDRGWVAPAPGGAIARPVVPPAPTGPVTVTGRVHLPESGATAARGNPLEVRRISPAKLTAAVPHPLYGGYVLLDEQQPPASGFTAIPSEHQNSWQNAGYVVQWWGFAVLTLGAFVWAARREAHPPGDRDEDFAGTPTG